MSSQNTTEKHTTLETKSQHNDATKKHNAPVTTANRIDLTKNVGIRNPKPDFGLDKHPLDRKKLKSMSKEERTAAIVCRANYYQELWGPISTGRVLTKFSKARTDAERNGQEFCCIKNPGKNVEPMDIPVKDLNEMFPMIEDENGRRLDKQEQQMKFVTSFSNATKKFDDAIKAFHKTKLKKTLEIHVHEKLKGVKIDKIVAFGLYTLCPPNEDLATRLYIQHAALLLVRETLQNLNKKMNEKFPIYLQDPLYIQLDEKITEQYNMQIVNCEAGHQLAYSMIDDKTLVVDILSHAPAIAMSMEIARPAALWLSFDPEERSPIQPYWYKFNHNGKDIIMPYKGELTCNAESILLKEYKYCHLDTKGMELGEAGSKVKHADGDHGEAYIGGNPCFFVRKPKLFWTTIMF